MSWIDSVASSEGNASSETPQQIAREILCKKYRLFDINSNPDLTTLPISSLLEDEHLPELLFRALHLKQDIREGNVEVYGVGNEDIHLDFGRLRTALVQLAHTGECESEVFKNAERVLLTLIKGVRGEEEEAKSGISPENAARLNSVLKDFSVSVIGVDAQGVSVPLVENMYYKNTNEDIQSEACECYMWFKSGRVVLESVLTGIRQINQAIGRDRSR